MDLHQTFFPWFRREMSLKPWIWQQDNATIHTAWKVFDCFYDEEVSTNNWPACSSDLSLIEKRLERFQGQGLHKWTTQQ